MELKIRLFFARTMVCTAILFAVLCLGVAGFAHWRYGVWLFEPAIYFKYLFSFLFDAAKIESVTVTVPKGLYAYVLSCGYDIRSIALYKFYLLLHGAAFGWLFRPLPYLIPVCFVTSVILVVRYFMPEETDARYVRGAQTISAKQLAKLLQRAQENDASGSPGLLASPLQIPGDLETRHFLTAGSTGTGKSVLLCQLLCGMQRRKAKRIVYDRKGELFAKFGKQGDILWNPYDKRFCGWTIFNEFELYAGLDRIPETLSAMADSLFSVSSTASGNSKHFYDGAASIFKSGCCYLKINDLQSNRELYNFFASGADKIAAAIATLPEGLREGQAFLCGNGEATASYMSCLMDRVKAFQSLIGKDGICSIRQWIQDPAKTNTLFLSTAGENDAAYLPLLTVLIDVIGSGIRAMNENPQRRIFLVLDELASLPPLKTLQMLLREGRSKGASIFLTTQTMAAIEGRYGKANAADITGLCNTLFVFRTNELEQSEYFSRALGNAERIKLRQTSGESRKSGALFDSNKNSSASEQSVTERLFLSGELQSLPVGCAIVKIADFPVAKVQFAHMTVPDRIPGFIQRQLHIATAEELAAARASAAQGANVEEEPSKPAVPTTFRI